MEEAAERFLKPENLALRRAPPEAEADPLARKLVAGIEIPGPEIP